MGHYSDCYEYNENKKCQEVYDKLLELIPSLTYREMLSVEYFIENLDSIKKVINLIDKLKY